MTSSWFNLGPTLKNLNIFLLRFIKRSGSENHDLSPTALVLVTLFFISFDLFIFYFFLGL